MSKSFISVCLLRVIYPLCLTASVCCRQDLITGIFLLLLLYIPFVPLPTSHTMSRHTGFFLKFSFAISVIMLTLQVAFQVVLMSVSNYGQIIQENCEGLEKIFRHIGFIRYDSLPVLDCVLHIAPEVIAMFSSFFVYVLCDRLNPQKPDVNSTEQGILMTMMQPPENTTNVRRSVMQKKAVIALTIIGKYLSLAVLCFTSILVPSITSGLLYAIFLCCVTYWACYKDLGRGFVLLCQFISVILFFYVIAIFCYQTEWIQEFLHPDWRIPRYFGLQALHLTNCTTDPRLFIVNPNLMWPSFVLPFALIALYNLLIFESRILLFVSEFLKKQPEKVTRQIKSTRLSQKNQKSSLFRNKTNRWRLATRQVVERPFLVESKKTEFPNESTPLIRGRESVYRRSANSAMSQDSHGSITVTNVDDDIMPKAIEEANEGDESLKVDIMEYLVDAFITVISFITRTSYIGTNIIMMTWSITYHSWLTFFLLLGAIVLWMVPNQRQSMLRVSPFLIFYAEFLLIAQFIWGMDLTNKEILTISFNIEHLDQIGFVKSPYAFKPLAIKTLFTTMFWITMRQYMRERQESRSTSTVAHMMAPVHVTVGTATAMGGDPASKGGQIIQKFGERVRKLMTKFWIWVVTITLFAIGVTGDEMTLFRIIYTALALFFVITFQLSWVAWRKMMYGFWLTVIIISMIILVLIYTFQFEGIQELWRKYLGVDDKCQKYIGLEKKDTSNLFFFLMIPTFFVIITVIQLKYFHKDFLLISDIKSRGTSTTQPKSRPSIMSDDEYATQTEEVSSRTEGTSPDEVQSPGSSKTLIQTENKDLQPSRPSFHVFGRAPNVKTLQTLDQVKLFVKQSVEVIWLFLELHIKKFVLILIILVSIKEVNVIHLLFIMGSVLAMMLTSKFQDIVIKLMSVYAAGVLLAEMIFQIWDFNTDSWSQNCTKVLDNGRNITSVVIQLNGTDWLGLYKTGEKSMIQLLSGYIWIIVAVTFYVVVTIRQKYVRHLRGRPLSRSMVLFPRISYKDVNENILSCVKYLFNYGFYRFGVEITFIFMVMLVGFRLDVVALIYATWLLFLINCSRSTLSRIWYFLNWFAALTIPLQYAVIVGLPPSFCFYPFEPQDPTLARAMRWFYLPVYEEKPLANKLFWDFMVLLFITRQNKVFKIERQYKDNDYPGGTNKSIIHEMESPNYVNPVPDFISDKRSYLDIIKHGVLCSLLWISCAVIFLAGTYSVTLFSFGYVIGSFLILWQGNDFYLRPIGTIMKWWNRIIIYNVGVMFCKAVFQIPGCIFSKFMMTHACWLVQLFGIVCINNFAFTNIFAGTALGNESSAEECRVATEKMGLGMDALCFVLLIFQKRLFSSHYFVRIVDEAKAMAVLAARGAELIEELSKKQIAKQQELEKTVLQKIKNKMDSIKAAQKKIQIKSKEIVTHTEAIRSGDYYMFDDEALQNLIEVKDNLDEVEEGDEEMEGKTLGKLMESVLRTDVKQALQPKALDESRSSGGESKRLTSTSKSSISSAVDEYEDDDVECSTCKNKSTDVTTSKDVTETIDESSSISIRHRGRMGSDRKRTSFKREKDEKREHDSDKGDSSDTDGGGTLTPDDDNGTPVAKCWDTLHTYWLFTCAFFDSCMISMIRFLNRKSKDHRYVIHALEKEKKILKETRNLRVGMRIHPDMKWQPIPAGLLSQGPRSPPKMEDFENEGLVVTKQPTFVRLLLAIYHAVMSHSDMVCYFAVFMLQIRNPTIASLPLSLMVFFWGTLSIPRPTKRFWVTMIAYTEVVVVVKSMCQSEFLNIPSIQDDLPFHPQRILGVEKDPHYGMYDLILLLAVFFHRSSLKSLGLWKSAEEFNKDNQATNLLNLDYVEPTRSSMASGSGSEAVTEMTTVNLIVLEQVPSEELAGQSTDSYQNQIPQMKINSRSLSTSKDNLFEPYTKAVNEFFNKLMDSRNRIADDVYAYMFFCDFCNIIVIIFGFSSFGASKGDGGVTQYIEDNKIPFAFLAMVILQFALIVVDRWLYLSRYIVGKLVFQYLLVIGIHIWMFFILPAVTQRKFNEAFPPSLWYLIKCFYLLLSAYQIRSGYPTRILGNFLCKNYNLVNMVLFKIFMLIPFVYELRTLMDWIWTETSMTLADWIKMEDIFSQIFQLKCMRRAEIKYPLPRSHKIPAKTKFIYGAGGLVTLFTIIWFPLVLFALGDTVGEPNRPTDMAAKVQISSYQPIYTSLTSKIFGLTEHQWESIKAVYKDSNAALTFLSDYNPEDVGVVFLPHYSSSVWTIPPPEENDLITELANCSSLKVSMELTLNRQSENPESPKTVSDAKSVDMTPEMCESTGAVLSWKNGSQAYIPHLMPKFLKITSLGKASPVVKLMRDGTITKKPEGNEDYLAYVGLNFTLERDFTATGVWWSAAETITYPFLREIDRIASNNSGTSSLIIYTFNDKMFPPGLLSLISGKGIIGLYTTFVIVVSAYVKGYFTGTTAHIMFEDMPYVDRILQLCLDIFLVRERREFGLEEDLFAKLLFLYRSPETMIKWTRPPEEGGWDEY